MRELMKSNGTSKFLGNKVRKKVQSKVRKVKILDTDTEVCRLTSKKKLLDC